MSTHLATYVALIHASETTLADSFDTIGQGHANHPDVLFTCQALAKMSRSHVAKLQPVVARYGEASDVEEPQRLHASGVGEVRSGAVGLLRDLQDLHMLATLVDSTWTVIGQGAQGLRDEELLSIEQTARKDVARQLAWLVTRMKSAAPQALIVAPPAAPLARTTIRRT
ncbi:hypothetical protein [Pedococcus soli]